MPTDQAVGRWSPQPGKEQELDAGYVPWPNEGSSAGGSVETIRSEGKEGIEVIGAAFKVIAGEPGSREDKKSPEAQPSQELELKELTSGHSGCQSVLTLQG